MFPYLNNKLVTVRGILHKKCIILADVNIPYKFSLDQSKNKLFFCINAGEFSDQSFHSVVLNLDTGLTSIIPGIRNGFASAVDHTAGVVYLGGSDGIFKYNYHTQSIDIPAILDGIDIFDMYFKNNLYFVDTATQNLFIYQNNKGKLVEKVKEYYIQHFVIDGNDDLIFVNSTGLFSLPKKASLPILYDNSSMNFRGAAADKHGVPHFITQDGIYFVDKENKELVKILSLDNGYGLAFDRDNNIVYSNERCVAKLIPCETT